jgi:hypothetical protein
MCAALMALAPMTMVMLVPHPELGTAPKGGMLTAFALAGE